MQKMTMLNIIQDATQKFTELIHLFKLHASSLAGFLTAFENHPASQYINSFSSNFSYLSVSLKLNFWEAP